MTMTGSWTGRIFSVGLLLTLAVSLPARADTLLHYDFSDGSGETVTDLSGKGNDGTLVDFADTSAGAGEFDVSEGWVPGGGLSFLDDSVRSFVETPLPLDELGLPGGGTKSHTIEFLASYGRSEGWTPAIGSDFDPFDGSEAYFFGIDSGRTQIHVRTPGGGASNVGPQPWQGGGAPRSQVVHHLAYVYDFGSDEVETFVDGVSAGTAGTGNALDMSIASDDTVFRIGNTGWAPGEQWAGVVSGVAISASALDAGSFALTNGNQPTTLLNYSFSDGSGTSVSDTSGNGNDGELVDFLDTSGGAGVFNQSEGWVAGGGLSFLDDAQRSYVETPLQINALDQSFTIEVQTNYAAPQGWAPLIGTNQDPFTSTDTLFAGVDSGGTMLHFRAPDGWATNIGDQPWLGDEETDETLHHVAMRYDEDTGDIEVFVDGDPLGTINLANTDYEFAQSLFRIGNVGWQPGEQWGGVIQGVAISDAYLEPDEFVLTQSPGQPRLEAGDADRDLDFDQLDLVQVQIANKYLSGQPATWGEGDWNGAPGGTQASPPPGDNLFNQVDIIAALSAGKYLTGPYAAVQPNGQTGDEQTSIRYDAATGEVAVDAPAGVELTSINIDSAAGIFTGDAAQNLGGSFDNDADNNIFKATFGSSFASLSFSNVAQPGLSQDFLLSDLSVVGSLQGGGALGDVDLIYVPEPAGLLLLALGLAVLAGGRFGRNLPV